MPEKKNAPPAAHPTYSPTVAGAEQITDFLKGALQTVRISYLFAGRLLDQARQQKIFATLGYADLESYARERLQLGRSALYSYLRVYDWVAKNHPEWLEPGPGTFIPELNDTVDLMWMEKELERKDLTATAKTGLETLKAKALNGSLTKKDVTAFRGRSQHQAGDGRKAFLVRMRALRASGTRLKGMPPEILTGLDELIAILKNAIALPVFGLEEGDAGKTARVA